MGSPLPSIPSILAWFSPRRGCYPWKILGKLHVRLDTFWRHFVQIYPYLSFAVLANKTFMIFRTRLGVCNNIDDVT